MDYPGGLWVEVTLWVLPAQVFMLCAHMKLTSHWQAFPSVCSASVRVWLPVVCSLRGNTGTEHLCREMASVVSSAKGKEPRLQPHCWRFGVREASSTSLHFPGVWSCCLCSLLPSPCWQPTPTPATESALAPIINDLSATSLGLSASLTRVDWVCRLHALLLLLRPPCSRVPSCLSSHYLCLWLALPPRPNAQMLRGFLQRLHPVPWL